MDKPKRWAQHPSGHTPYMGNSGGRNLTFCHGCKKFIEIDIPLGVLHYQCKDCFKKNIVDKRKFK